MGFFVNDGGKKSVQGKRVIFLKGNPALQSITENGILESKGDECAMRTQKIRLLPALLAAVMLFCQLPRASAAEAVLPSGLEEGAVGTAIEEFVEEHESTAAGMAVAVVGKDRVIYRNYFGYADREQGIAVDENTVMEWGSVTKLLVWVSAMQLWEQGKLDLEADIREYLPEGFLRNLKYDSPVTMLHLMNHNAGFEETFIGMMTPEEERIQSLEAYLTTIQPRQVYQPGTVTAYSNWGVALAGYVVERISGIPFYEYAKSHIFVPLGMEHTALNADLSDNPWVKQQRSQLHCYTAEGALIPNCWHYIVMYPAGMCTSTLDDFQRFAMALLDRESPLFADPATYDVFVSPSDYFGDTDIPLNHHGMWSEAYYSVHVIGHGGNTMGCSAQLLLDLENGVGMVVMTNQSGEGNFTGRMPELIFGSCGYEILDFTGYALSGRTILRGPMKIYQLLCSYSLTPESSEGALCVLSESGGIRKITVPSGGGDYIVLTLPQLILMWLPAALWAVALVFCMIGLAAKGIRAVIRKLRRKPRMVPPERWTTLACVLQPLPLIPLVPLMLTLTSGNQWAIWQYRMVFGMFLLAAVVFAVLAVWGIVRMCRRKRATVFQVSVVLSLLISIANILYWELGCFWMI